MLPLRAFVALEVNESVRDSLAAFQAEVRSTGADLKLVGRGNLHFTVKFLGEITDAQASVASSRIGSLALKGSEVEVKGAGAFPSPGRPRVVWAGVAPEHQEAMASVAEPVLEALRDLGERDDRSFQAHITLARVRSPRNSRQLTELLTRNGQRSFGKVKLTELKLKSSTLTSQGPIYSDIGAFKLA